MSGMSLGVTAPVATSRAVHMNSPSMGADVAQLLQSEVGVNILLGRLKQSIKSAQDFAQYVRQRAITEEGYAQSLQDINYGLRSSVFSFWRTGQRISLDANSSTPGLQVVRDLSSAGIFYATSLHKLASETKATIMQFEKEWKSWNKITAANAKRLRMLEVEAENAKSQHRHLEENFVRAKNGTNGTFFGLVPGKRLDPFEEAQYHIRIQTANDELLLKSEAFRLERQHSIDAQSQQVFIAVGGLIQECDKFLNSQLEEYTTLYLSATQIYQSCLTSQASQQQQSGLAIQGPVAQASPSLGRVPNASPNGAQSGQSMPRPRPPNPQANSRPLANPQMRQQPPTQQPRTQQPPTQQPRTQQTPAQQPQTQQTPAQQPRTQQPPIQQPPIRQPPTQQPQIRQPPTQQPPTEQRPTQQRPNPPLGRQSGPLALRPPPHAHAANVGQEPPKPPQVGTSQPRSPQVLSQARVGQVPVRPPGPSQNVSPQPVLAQNRTVRPEGPQPRRIPPEVAQAGAGIPGPAPSRPVQGSVPQSRLAHNGPPPRRNGPPQTSATSVAPSGPIQQPANPSRENAPQHHPVNAQSRPVSARPAADVSSQSARAVTSIPHRPRPSGPDVRPPARSELRRTSVSDAGEVITPAARRYHAQMYPELAKNPHSIAPSIYSEPFSLAHARPPIAWLPPPNPTWSHAAPLTPPYPVFAQPLLAQTMHSPTPPPAAYSLPSSIYPAVAYSAAYTASSPAHPQYLLPQSPYMPPSSYTPPYPVSGQSVPLGVAQPPLGFGQYTMVPHGALQPTLQQIPPVAAAINQPAAPPPSVQHLPSPAQIDAVPADKAYQQNLSRPPQAEKILPQEHFQDSVIREAARPIQTMQPSVQSRSMRPQALQPSVNPASTVIISNQKSALQRTPDHTSDQQHNLASTVSVPRGEAVAQSRSAQQPSQKSIPKQSSTPKPGTAENLALTAQPKPSEQSNPTIRNEDGSVHEVAKASARVLDVEANPTEQISHQSPRQSLHRPIQANNQHVTQRDLQQLIEKSAERILQLDQANSHPQHPDQLLAHRHPQPDLERAPHGLSQQPRQHARQLADPESCEGMNQGTTQDSTADKMQGTPQEAPQQASQRAFHERPGGRTGEITQANSSKPSETNQMFLKQGPHSSERKNVEPHTANLPLPSEDDKGVNVHGDKILSSNFKPDSVSKLHAPALPITTPETVVLDSNRNLSTLVPPLKPSADHGKSDNLGVGNVLDGHSTPPKPQPSPNPNTDINQPAGGPPVDQPLLMANTQKQQPKLVQE